MPTRCVLACLHASLSRFLHYLCDNVGVVVVQACEGLGAVTVKQRRKINSIASEVHQINFRSVLEQLVSEAPRSTPLTVPSPR